MSKLKHLDLMWKHLIGPKSGMHVCGKVFLVPFVLVMGYLFSLFSIIDRD